MWKKIIIVITLIMLLVGCASKSINLKEVSEYDKYVVGDLDGETVVVEGKVIYKTMKDGINYYTIIYTSIEDVIFQSYSISDYGDSSKLEGASEGDYVKITNAKVNGTSWGDKIDTNGNLEKIERDILINSNNCKVEIIKDWDAK